MNMLGLGNESSFVDSDAWGNDNTDSFSDLKLKEVYNYKFSKSCSKIKIHSNDFTEIHKLNLIENENKAK